MILYEEGQNAAQQGEAHDLMGLLTLAYPDHPWAVRVGDGFIFVRYLDPFWEETCRGPVGYKINAGKSYSSSQMKREVLMAAGQLLEMMNLRRGRSNGDEPTAIDGIPKQFLKKQAEVPKVIVPNETSSPDLG